MLIALVGDARPRVVTGRERVGGLSVGGALHNE